MFKKVYGAVLSFLGIDALPKKDGKSVLTADMREKLVEKWGETFVTSYETDLAEAEKDGKDAGEDPEIASYQKQLADMKAAFEK
ncbi:MAG: hypothetical protein LBI65_01600, partial [Candidatus Symbiothrix sp.]|nr:hypothetical protein [Candidatus Symbiothrix sp.]